MDDLTALLSLACLILIIGVFNLNAKRYFYKNKIGYPISEIYLNEEIYRIISSVPHQGRVYYLLVSGKKTVTCCVNQEEGFKNFTIEGDNLLLPKQ